MKRIMRKFWQRVQRKSSPADSIEPSQAVRATADYASDQPITSAIDDRFGRWPFASRIAETLATRTDRSSVVIGMYGPWGDGKTSTLRLIEEALSVRPRGLRVI